MKRILAAGSIAALAVLGFAGTANAAPSDSACFGQTHKAVNSGDVGVDNVGQLVQSLDGRGQGKKELVYSAFC
jgi:hypothetical protein